MKYPLPVLTVCFALGIGCGTLIGHYFIIECVVVGALALSLLFVRGSRLFFPLVVLLFIALGILAVHTSMAPDAETPFIGDFVDYEFHNITGTVRDAPESFPAYTRFILTDVKIKKDNAWQPVWGDIGLTVYKPIDGVAALDTLSFWGKLKKPKNFNNPGGFDYERYLERRGVYATVSLSDDTFLLRSQYKSRTLVTCLEKTRSAIKNSLFATLPVDEASVITALTIGDRTHIREDLLKSYYETGVGHILAISGLNVGIFFIISYFVLFFIIVRIPRLPHLIFVRTYASVLALIPVLAYTAIADFQITAVRSSLMICAVVLSMIVKRERNTANILFLAGFLILLFSPLALFDPSFQLSFMAVLGIIVVYPVITNPVKNRIYRVEGVKPHVMARGFFMTYEFFAVSIASLAGVLPISAFYFYRATPLALLLNFVVIPLLGFFSTPLALIALPALPFYPFLGSMMMKVASLGVHLSNEAVIFAHRLFPHKFLVFPPTIFEIVLYYAILTGALLWFTRKGRIKRASALLLLISFLVLLVDVGASIYNI